MFRIIFLIFGIQLIVLSELQTQNLVYNGDFEVFQNCPFTENQLNACWGWSNPAKTTPDYFNSCGKGLFRTPKNYFGYQKPHSGEGYAGIINFWVRNEYYQEYLATHLTKALKKGQVYTVSMYVSLADSSQYYLNSFCFCFKSTLGSFYYHEKLNKHKMLSCDNGLLICNNEVITNTTNWFLIQGEYIANGDEDYLIIGLFPENKVEKHHLERGNATHIGNRPYAYYYIDDVSVTERNSVLGD